MPENTSPIFDFRAGGVRHPPEADIESIRDLLRGYGSSPGILKELIQNAEDAGARRMDMLYLPADPDAPHRLLRGPSLLVINDGAFKPEHRDAITQINLGTKGTEERAIGRFGKGLKSVFAWCEAFFFIARTDPQWGWQKAKMADFFNPWHKWRHEEWEAEFQEQAEAIATRAVEHFSNIYPEDKPWLAFWFPLRQQISAVTAEEEWIQEYFPGDDPNFWQGLAKELRELAPSLVALRNLNKLALLDRNPGSGDSHVLQFPDDSHRVPAPDLAPERMTIEGVITLSSKASPELAHRFRGVAGRLLDERVMHLKSKEDWPKVVQRVNGRNRASAPVKGEPHFASLITWHPITEKESTGSLDLRWCVFFPVGKQPTGKERITLPSLARHITINLHGFFFLDSERLHIDGLEEQFKTNGSNGSNSCIAWNHIVATQGVLANLPRALHDFAQAENLDPTQRWELAEAMRQTWEWNRFQQEICQRETWRPRWRSGVETWECLPTAKSVLPIPVPTNANELLSCLPMLSRISEEHTLVTKADDGTMQGLHTGTCGRWPEELLLRLFSNVNVSAAGNESTIRWINSFVTELKQTNSLTPRIYGLISMLPLLEVVNVRENAPQRLSVKGWETIAQNDQLFESSDPSERWLGLLRDAFEDPLFVAANYDRPRWFLGNHPPKCDETCTARVVLKQIDLGSVAFTRRLQLWNTFASLPERKPLIRLAMRYLMHTDRLHVEDATTSLWIPPVASEQQIWVRLFDNLYEDDGGTQSWRLLHPEWKNEISGHLQQELGINSVDADGAWQELIQNQCVVSRLEFPTDAWSEKDIATLLQGLYEAGKFRQRETLGLLRRLRVHTLAGNTEQRVSVAAPNGQLDEHFVLHTKDFEERIPAELKAIWQAFLAETKIIARFLSDLLANSVQEKIFQRHDQEGNEYLVELNWNYVIRRCLEFGDVNGRAQLILQALAIQGYAPRDITDRFKTSKWLPLELGGYIAPDSIIHIEGLEDDLHKLLDPVRDSLTGIRALPAWVSNHPGFKALPNYLPRTREALQMLGMWLAEKPDWHLGLTKDFQIAELKPLLAQLKDFESLPIASLLLKLCSLPDETLISWVQEYILPAVLKMFDYEQEGLNKIKDILCRLQSLKSREAFDAYLYQACGDRIVGELLPALFLVNQRGEWKSARQLIWPSENLDPAAQLCDEQAKILSSLHEESAKHESPTVGQEQGLTLTKGNQLLAPPDFEAQEEKLKDYLRPFTAGNVGMNLIAALVAVLGGHPKFRTLLEHLLRTGLGQTPEIFIARLFGEREETPFATMESVRFLIDIVRTPSLETRSLTNEPLMVALTDEVKTLIVGNANDLWFNYYYKNQPCRILRLRWIEQPDNLTDLVSIFAATIETIYLKVHCNGVASLCPSNLKEILADIADAGQVALRRSQLYLLDMAEARLKELGVKGVPQFQAVLQEFDEARQARVDAEDLASQAPAKAKQRAKQAEDKRRSATDNLLKLLKEPEAAEVRHLLVQAVRRKMTDFQYSLASVLQELFQNADDAAAEWKEMRQSLDPQEQRFVLHINKAEQVLEIFHWGRPINQHEYPGFTAWRNRGYDQDLVKMLTLNFSDKGVERDAEQSIVTGLFGLGFKSVFFVAEEPQVISGRLAFEIRGGFYPVPLAKEIADEMRRKAEELGKASIVPTVVRLRWKKEENLAAELDQAIANFTRVAPLLTIFSRHLRTLIVPDDCANNTWTNVEQSLTESKQVTHVRVGSRDYLCFRCPLSSDQRPATVLFQLNPNGITQLDNDLTGLWITTPTAERSELRWALNAPFKPDAGRQQLALNNSDNKTIAEEMARAWGKALIELFDEAEKNWSAMATKLGLHNNVNAMKLWQQLWQETTRSAPILHWDEVREGGQLLNWVAWGDSIGAVRGLIEYRNAIPSGLPGTYEKMLSLRDVKYALTGILAETDNGCFTEVEKWETIRSSFPPGQTVSQKTGDRLRQIVPDLSLKPLTLREVFAAEIGTQKLVKPESAERIGTILDTCEAIFETNSPAWHEDGLRDWVEQGQLRFLAQDGFFYPASDLICDRTVTDLIEKDETLRAAFAPENAKISPHYSEMALRFFVKARRQKQARASTLKMWVFAVPEGKLKDVFIYLTEGKLRFELAVELGRSWFDDHKNRDAFQNLLPKQKQELEWIFAKDSPSLSLLSLLPPPIITPIPTTQVMDAEDAFCCISDWWKQEQNKWVAQYEAKTYPAGFPGTLYWPGEDAWDDESVPSAQSRWLLLFVHAALVPLGFNKLGRDQSFSQFLLSKNLLEVFAKASSEPIALLSAIDQYLDQFISETQFHFQMRQFITFYAVGKNLEAILLSLREAERAQSADAFHLVFRPRANSILTGTGIEAPPLTGMLGMGSCYLLRELYRIGRLRNPLGHSFAFTPIRKVRQLCAQLFDTREESLGASSSQEIFSKLDTLGKTLGLDATFGHCFDLPFQFLAENPSLRREVLNIEFEVMAEDSPELDAAPAREGLQ